MSSNEELINEGKNKLTAYCSRCPSKILSSGMGTYTDSKFCLPHMHHKAEGEDQSAGEDISEYWQVADIFTFENIGFSKPVDNLKYLLCADCEIGPLGWHDISSKQSYLALSRVKHS